MTGCSPRTPRDAFAAALVRWPRDGIPDRPAAWFTARTQPGDRHSALGESNDHRLAELSLRFEPTDAQDIEDDRLRLIFTCCHPALPLAARVSLTLRTVAGLPVAEIARAFLVSETTMAQRLVRARRKIDHAGIPYRVPPAELLEERLNGVLAVLYLAFNAGYTTARHRSGDARSVSLASSSTSCRSSPKRVGCWRSCCYKARGAMRAASALRASC